MIDIRRFREFLAETRQSINSRHTDDAQIEGIALAVRENHLIKKLKDRRGIQLCAKYPDATVRGHADNFESDNDLVLFLLEKVPSGSQTDDEELMHYATLQRLMLTLRDLVMESPLLCGDNGWLDGDMTVEWEYDIYGGWNGLSIGFKLNDHD